MVTNSKVVLLGYSGHGLAVADIALESGMPVYAYTDRDAKRSNPFNLKYLGFESELEDDFWETTDCYVLGIGDNHVRKKVAELISSKEKEILNVIHPSASISKNITIGKGNFISRNVAVNISTSIGNYCILNTGCVIEHEAIVESCSHIGPGAVLAGGVVVGQGTFIGANAIVKNGVKIGQNAVIGAGAVILRDVRDNATVVGNPGKEL